MAEFKELEVLQSVHVKIIMIAMKQNSQFVMMELVLNVEIMMTVQHQEWKNVKIMSVFHVMTIYNVLKQDSQSAFQELADNVEIMVNVILQLKSVCRLCVYQWQDVPQILNVQLQDSHSVNQDNV